ncbi:MAG: hypothetical protein K2J63_12375 [Muribaculaceae bacterium]|nr:hypothetical protein [Muribaculaceae bacterium]MDE6796085.1 hypothetical protein [Muribaculaceae bacterium]
MKQKSRNILSVKRKRRQLARTSQKQLFCSGANVCVGVEAMCRIMSGNFNKTKIITI